ncbi:hypothetical protein AAMO2058_000095900 [Amorphochlora amoebiformis]
MARPQMGATRLAGIRRVSRSRFVSKWNVSVSTIVIVSVCVAVPVVFVHNVVSRTTTPIGYPLGVEMEEWSGKVDIHMKKRQYLYAKHKRILHELLEKSEKVNQLIEETGEDTQDPYYKKIKRELVALENDYTNVREELNVLTRNLMLFSKEYPLNNENVEHLPWPRPRMEAVID